MEIVKEKLRTSKIDSLINHPNVRNTFKRPMGFGISLLKKMSQKNMMNGWLVRPTLSLQREKVLHPGERELKPAVVIKALNIIYTDA